MESCEPCQVRKEAAISRSLRVPQECLFLWPIEKIRTRKPGGKQKSFPPGFFVLWKNGGSAVHSVQGQIAVLSLRLGLSSIRHKNSYDAAM